MSRVTVLRPDFIEPPRAALTLAPRTEPPEPLVIGLISNGKPLAAELLQALVEELRKRLRREITIEMIRKPSPFPVVGHGFLSTVSRSGTQRRRKSRWHRWNPSPRPIRRRRKQC